jgi:hypothetical protein
MMKAKDLHESVWDSQDNGLVQVRKEKGGYYGFGDKYDFTFITAKELFDSFKKWGYSFAGWDNF